jgi:tetratricopeptide (TPR) repeat protein
MEAQTALDCDPGLAEAHVHIGAVAALYDWNFTEAEACFRRAIGMCPHLPIALQWYGSAYLAPLMRFDEALTYLHRAQQLDPLSPMILNALAYVLCVSGQLDAAADQLFRAIELDSGFPLSYWTLGLVYEARTHFDKAINEFDKACQLSNGLAFALASLGHAYALAGDLTQAQRVLTRFEERSANEYVPSSEIAIVYLGLGRRREALDHLEAAFDARCPWLVRLKIDPRTRDLQTEQRFTTLLQRVGIAAP